MFPPSDVLLNFPPAELELVLAPYDPLVAPVQGGMVDTAIRELGAKLSGSPTWAPAWENLELGNGSPLRAEGLRGGQAKFGGFWETLVRVAREVPNILARGLKGWLAFVRATWGPGDSGQRPATPALRRM